MCLACSLTIGCCMVCGQCQVRAILRSRMLAYLGSGMFLHFKFDQTYATLLIITSGSFACVSIVLFVVTPDRRLRTIQLSCKSACRCATIRKRDPWQRIGPPIGMDTPPLRKPWMLQNPLPQEAGLPFAFPKHWYWAKPVLPSVGLCDATLHPYATLR